jgi:ATP-dependent 26S proteasome regulatory subunit
MAVTEGPGIREYLQAGYPCLFLPTVEPEVAEGRVRDALKSLDLGSIDFGVWKITNGFMVGTVDETVPPMRKAEDLYEVLANIEVAQAPICAIIHNMRHFISNPQIQQALIDAIYAARLKGSHIILVGAFLELPPELRSLVTFVECPLPTRSQISLKFLEIVDAYRDEIKNLPSEKDLEKLIDDAATAAVGLDLMGAENAIALSLATRDEIDIRIIQAQKEQEVRKSDVLEFVRVDESMSNVGGFGRFKEWLKRRERVFTDEARAYRLPYPKGMLIVGPAGTGKSLVAKAVGSYLRLPLLRLDMGKVFRSLVGESEAAIRTALSVAEAVSPCVMWMDEIDKGLAGMRGSGELDSGVTARVVSTILTWRQETTYPVVLLATANDVAAIPSMVYRKGRLDEVWATDLPTHEERIEIFAIHLKKRGRDPKKFSLDLLSQKAERMVGAEIEGVIEDAMFSAFDQGEEVATSHILQSIEDTVPQAERDAEELHAIREWVKTRARMVGGEDRPEPSHSKVRKLRKTKKEANDGKKD